MSPTLTDLIEQLTREHPITINRHGQHIGYRTQKPLLDLLAAAVHSTAATSSNGGRGGDITPRLGFDAVASELHTAIRRRIRGWAIDANVPRHWAEGPLTVDWRDTTALLAAWHQHARTTDAETHTTTLHGWVIAITDLVIDPPRRIPIDAPCPECGSRWAYDNDGIRIDALRSLARDPATDTTTDCRACGAHWTGLDGAEHLAALIARAAS